MADMMRNSRMNNNELRNGRQSTDKMMQSTSCKSMQKKLQMIDFAIVDTVLYLNAYPDNARALDYYHKLIKEREVLMATINKKCGPITAMGNESHSEWNWISGPWPWEVDAN